ncbi:YMGG-like glycine zipper-containing protein [Pseudovibrio exalbescens]|uniref:Bacteriocin n=1 Tax=Pseudovibrio exalbescens TaxID=197461 RepID=A0A1U7JL18_9HYPH|nr:YMGG-like glycine zipper-containing protein [Pseudovibrio exalbescens]OKL45341.1 bacteriocin [Pseudovibrio exalbescens]
MKKIALVSVALLALAGCNTSSQGDRTLAGAGIGAATGAAVGAATGGNTGSTLAGAAIGGVAGGIIGNQTAPKNCTAYDQNGRPYAVPCP